MKEFLELLIYLSIGLALLLFFGPIVVIISIIGQINVGTVYVDLSKKGWPSRLAIALLGLGSWISVYVLLVLVVLGIVPKLPTPVALPTGTPPATNIASTTLTTVTPPVTSIASATLTVQPSIASTVPLTPSIVVPINTSVPTRTVVLTNTVVPANTSQIASTPAPTTRFSCVPPAYFTGEKWRNVGDIAITRTNTSLDITIQPGSSRDLLETDWTAPHMLQEIKGDFEIYTRVRFNPRESYQGAGILVWQDEQHFLRLERGFGGGPDFRQSGIQIDALIRTGKFVNVHSTGEREITSDLVELLMQREDAKFIASWRRPNEKDDEWHKVIILWPDFQPIKGGIAVVTTKSVRVPTQATFECIWISLPQTP